MKVKLAACSYNKTMDSIFPILLCKSNNLLNIEIKKIGGSEKVDNICNAGSQDIVEKMLQRKVNRILSERVETPELMTTLQTLSNFYGENTRENRHNLRSVLERQGHRINEEFVQTFQGERGEEGNKMEKKKKKRTIVDEFERIAQSTDMLSKECEEISKILDNTEDATNQLLEQTNDLMKKKQTLEKKEDMVKKFLSKFDLSTKESNEWTAFEQNKEKLTIDTLVIFERMQHIRKDCKHYLTHYHSRASLDIMDRFGKKLEIGFFFFFFKKKVVNINN
ncbi:hypothetical protein RFI_12122 [Reticulomyxa filosa]|uniref:Conserved oligomeric Golgi complex subunit 6 n=1 Tax=Reticulomyxa filosa TaxID=46433 RepID=X6NGJ5_RETFI|nr:hypothetical protein RFI_12122 [Reticulomyxa filosa]|eukprot:ETO25023.1 hypothetical protein RFI_12122 [Reticulomyxa filosa]